MLSLSTRSCAALALALVFLGCAEPAASVEEQAMTTSNLDEAESAPLPVGAAVTLRLSVDIRADLLPRAKLSDTGPYQAIDYGERPNMLVIADGKVSTERAAPGAWTCEIRGSRPRPGMNERFFAPILPNPLSLEVLRAPKGTGGVSIFLRSPTPDANDTTWSVDCTKDSRTARGASLAELGEAFDAASSVALD